MAQEDYILQVKNLSTWFKLDYGMLKAVNDVSFSLKRNQTLGIIGESGCGKSVTASSILRTVTTPGKIVGGQIFYNDGKKEADLTKYKPDGAEIRSIRGNEISMIFQEPMASLAPVYTIGAQMMEEILVHTPKQQRDKKKAKETCIEMLKAVGMPDPEQKFNSYPHQLSGGQCQRAMIASAMVNRPKILIADEPTTALDVTVQAQINDLMKSFQKQYNMSIIYITHDMGVIAEMADSIAVMYLGRVVESGSAVQIFKHPVHPYTRALLRSMPVLGHKTTEHLPAIEGNVPVPIDPPDNCGFCTRCLEKMEMCAHVVPQTIEIEPGHFVRCHKFNPAD